MILVIADSVGRMAKGLGDIVFPEGVRLLITRPPLTLLLGTSPSQQAKLFAVGNLCRSWPMLVSRHSTVLKLMPLTANRSVWK